MATELDANAKDALRRLRPGGRFTIKGVPGTFECKEWHHPIEQEPWCDAYRVENGMLTAYRAIRVSRVDCVV